MKNYKPGSLPDPAGYISMIHVEPDCIDHPLTRKILARAENIPFKVLSENKSRMPDLGFYPKSLSAGKRHLLLANNHGKFFKPCPGTREYICCDYQFLNIA